MERLYHLLTSLCIGIVISSCSNEDSITTEPFTPQTYDIQGKVEKGPFISGSSISIQPMDAKLQVLGSVYNTVITDDLGNFILGNKEFSTPYAEFMANGYFFNEVKGELSNSTLTLRALVDLTNSTTINVNILTHLKYARVKNLVLSGTHFDKANSQAQKELFEAFGLSSLTDKEVSSFSIISGTDESAALIAISSLLLSDRSEAALTEYLSRLSADFGKNGKFSENIKAQIAIDKNKLVQHLSDIKDNIIERYNELGIEITVKELAHYVDWDNDGRAGNEILKANECVNLNKSEIAIPNEGGKFSIQISSPITIYLKPQIETENLDVPSSNVSDNYFGNGLYEGYDDSNFADDEIICENRIENNTLYISVSSLQSKANKNKTINLYDFIGNIVASVHLTQEGNHSNIPASETPLLGENAEKIVYSIAHTIADGLKDYTTIEQFYNDNKNTNAVNDYVNPSSSKISNAWSSFYSANRYLITLKNADETRLNVYTDYCNVLSAVYYSNLIYGWGDIPYIIDYTTIASNNPNIPRESKQTIFSDIKNKLTKALENLPDKKNEPFKDANGLFFVSKDVVRVLLSNIYMYEGKYNDALKLLQMIIDNGFYTLDTSTNNNYATESSEIIFAFLHDTGIIPYMTLSDIYLSLAECFYKTGDIYNAEKFINDVIVAKEINVSETDILMKIKNIREQILINNGSYFAFLKRTGLAKDICGIENFQLLFPIPNNEIYSNMNIVQNPGY
ncbi:MAG: RagB/SusD family nutrient uptake outer membrane protein [Bacteroidales bacterium]|nr:RagB/SusD family nutrient uptake outer membrane protein [Bacteroidales bacterium]